MRYEIIFSGIGGQGMILCGKIAAEAASIYEKKHSVQTVYYGPESRGGIAESYVIISDEPVDYPKITRAHALVAMSQSGLDRHLAHIHENAVIITETGKVVTEGRIPRRASLSAGAFTEESIRIMARPLAANIVALGLFSAKTQMISPEACKKAIRHNVPAGTEEKNIAAFDAGYQLGING
ncbi:MAG TPA: 2-oxoacid:ferredoxin oxidoreductase subunit gamma [Firmicutes bacterium]|nr:2-oxoacid:ferredoxin oxidoreductase subunit gamma [Bacillota bacterium]